MRTTDNLGLQIPEEDEFFDIGYVAHNSEILDKEIKDIKDESINDESPTYEEASDLSGLTSGEKISVAFGKLKKAISTLISHIKTAATSSVLGHVKVTTGNGLKNSSGTISMEKGTGTDYGSVKLSDTYDSKVTNGAAANGIGVSQNALYEAYDKLSTDIKETNNNLSKKADTTALNAYSSIGKIYTNTFDGTFTDGATVCSLSLPTGHVYIVIGFIQNRSSGQLGTYLLGDSLWNVNQTDRSTNGSWRACNVTSIATNGGNCYITTQNQSGGAQSVWGRLSAICIK